MSIWRKLITGGAIALLLAGCSGAGSTPGASTPATSASAAASAAASASPSSAAGGVEEWLAGVKAKFSGQTINMLMASHPSTSAYKEIIKPFEAATGVKVNIDAFEEGAMLEKQLLECQRGSDSYDIYMTAVEGAAFMASTGCEVALDDSIAKAPSFYDYQDLVPAYRGLFTVSDKEWAIPFAGETVILIYRKDLFDAKGLQPPKTWDELATIAKQFKDEGKVDGVVFRARKGWEFTYSYSIFLFPFGGQMFDPNSETPNIDTPGSKAALDYMTKLKDYGPTGMEAFSFPEAWSAMQTGTVAMAVEASAGAPEMENPDKSQVAGKLGYAALPAGPAGAYSGVWGWGLGINGKSKNQELAWDVITWLTGKQTQPEYLAAGGIPSRTSAFEDPALQAKYPFFPATLASLEEADALAQKGYSVVPKVPQWNEVSNVIGDTGSQAFVGQITSAAALKTMQAEMTKIMAK